MTGCVLWEGARSVTAKDTFMEVETWWLWPFQRRPAAALLVEMPDCPDELLPCKWGGTAKPKSGMDADVEVPVSSQ
jgi:hypothetical protein